MRLKFLALAFAAAVAAAPAFAQAPAGRPINVRGTVERLDGPALTVSSRMGGDVVVTLQPKVGILGVAKRSIADIGPGDFIASTAMKGTDGKLHALEIHIFTAAQRKFVPQEQTPYDLAPHSLMTNAIVEGVASAPHGRAFMLTYKGHQAELVVPPGTPIVALVPGGRSLLVKGAAVVVAARKDAAGKLVALYITAEKNGVKPPM